MARWLSFFAEYDFWVEHKPGRLNVVADALSRRPDYAVKTADANRIGVEPRFWQEVFTLLGTQLSISTADHPQTDGQTERVNLVLGDLLKSYAHSLQQWSDCLPMAEFAINNSVHASTGHTPFYVNAMRHPRLPSMIGTVASSLSGRGSTVASEQPQKSADTATVSSMATRRQAASRSGNETTDKNYGSVQGTDGAQAGPAAEKNAVLNKPFSTQAMDFVQRRQAAIRFVQDAIAASVDRQKLNADNVDRGNTNEFEKGSLVLLATQNLPRHAVSDFGASKLAPRFIACGSIRHSMSGS
ncbi:hypothetical protein PC117_g25356 [Phytophthora cactorum]|uniref:Integrase catalytic domain-containing protein n=1 Tax=Phytophthora cactorum TaxID=29920 RepID=A0A8T1ANG5_9STRA|nr:hypothetical protein PC117_g25356 [Phytophthora cactorum]